MSYQMNKTKFNDNLDSKRESKVFNLNKSVYQHQV